MISNISNEDYKRCEELQRYLDAPRSLNEGEYDRAVYLMDHLRYRFLAERNLLRILKEESDWGKMMAL